MVKAIGHRVVHAGEYFQEAVIVTEDVIERIEELGRLAPLHNPPNAQGIRIGAEIFPGKPQVAVFDTGFHQTLPPYAFHWLGAIGALAFVRPRWLARVAVAGAIALAVSRAFYLWIALY